MLDVDNCSKVFKSCEIIRTVHADPLVCDPYESTMVRIQTSAIPGASEGLFARQVTNVKLHEIAVRRI
jgi:hypothetical protein